MPLVQYFMYSSGKEVGFMWDTPGRGGLEVGIPVVVVQVQVDVYVHSLHQEYTLIVPK